MGGIPGFSIAETSQLSNLPTTVKEADAAGWDRYYDATAGRPPRRTLLAALERFKGSTVHRAVDLGCGDGRDTVALLSRGWSVIAIDAAPTAIERLMACPALPPDIAMTVLCQKFEEANWPTVDLVNASFSLPLCAPEDFNGLWQKIARSLLPSGRFAGQLYGDRDDWAKKAGVTVFNEAAGRRLFDSFEIELFEEEETDTVTPRGKAKHWHIFHIVARKR
jgi:SAM-dependent methyltransferase